MKGNRRRELPPESTGPRSSPPIGDELKEIAEQIAERTGHSEAHVLGSLDLLQRAVEVVVYECPECGVWRRHKNESGPRVECPACGYASVNDHPSLSVWATGPGAEEIGATGDV